MLLRATCALSLAPKVQQEKTLELIGKLTRVTVVANAFTNAWLQDRRGCLAESGVAIPEEPARTPQWRGLTLVQEFQERGTSVALGGDNVRDWWFNYGDSDPLEVFRFGVIQGHLDKPHGSLARWATAANRVPSRAFGEQFCRSALGDVSELAIGPGATADLIIFNARNFSELLSRPQSDRIVLRTQKNPGESAPTEADSLYIASSDLPDYSELDDLMTQSASRF